MSKKRSAHRFFSFSQKPKISTPTNFVKISGMASIAEVPPTDSGRIQTSPRDDPLRNGKSEGLEESDRDLEHSQTNHTAINGTGTGSAPHTPRKPTDLHPLKSHPITPSSDEDAASDFTRRGIHIPSRTRYPTSGPHSRTMKANQQSSSTGKASLPRRRLLRTSSNPSHSLRSRSRPTTSRSYSRGADSSASSIHSADSETGSTASPTLAPLHFQQRRASSNLDRLSPLLEDDPDSFDLVPPDDAPPHGEFPLEAMAEALFASQHLDAILHHDPPSLHSFAAFLRRAKPDVVPVLRYYLDASKALRAVNYANAVADALARVQDFEFGHHPPRPTVNAVLEEKARNAFDVLARDALPAFVTHVFARVVGEWVQKRVAGTLGPAAALGDGREGEGLAEVFCLCDPRRGDCPVLFASEGEFLLCCALVFFSCVLFMGWVRVRVRQRC